MYNFSQGYETKYGPTASFDELVSKNSTNELLKCYMLLADLLAFGPIKESLILDFVTKMNREERVIAIEKVKQALTNS